MPSYQERASIWVYGYGSLRGLWPKGIHGEFFTFGFLSLTLSISLITLLTMG